MRNGGTIEHWAFLGVVLTLAIEFAASHLAKPHRKIIDNARELEMVRLNHEADMAKGQIADATARAAIVLAETRSDRRCLVKRSGFGVRRY